MQRAGLAEWFGNRVSGQTMRVRLARPVLLRAAQSVVVVGGGLETNSGFQQWAHSTAVAN